MQFKAFNFTQATPSVAWSINHELNCKPVIDVFANLNGSIQKVFPLEIIYVDDNNVVVTFTAPESGGARLVGQTLDIIRSPNDTYIDHDNV